MGAEIDLRQEFQNTLYGHGAETKKGMTVLIRRLRRDPITYARTDCACKDSFTKEPDLDSVCPYCLTGDSLIHTSSGLIPIKDIIVGQKALTIDGRYHQIIDKQTTYTDKLIHIKSRLRSVPLSVTPDHLMIVIKKEDYMSRQFIPSEVPARDIRKGDLLLKPRTVAFKDIEDLNIDWKEYCAHNSCAEKLPTELPLTNELLWCFGLYIAEGHIGGDREICFSLHIDESDFAARVEKVFTDHFPNLNVRHSIKEDVNTRQVLICNSALASWFKTTFGQGCDSKRIPSFISNLPTSKSISAVRGIIDGEGWSERNQETDRDSYRNVVGMTSRQVVYTMQDILWNHGIYAGITMYEAKNKLPAYYLEWTSNRKIKSLPRQFYEFENYWGSVVTSIELEDLDIAIPVYDLTVEGKHSFVANNTLVHNCLGEGYLWDEELATCYKVPVKASKNWESAGTMYVEKYKFYFDHNINLLEGDSIIELVLDKNGNIEPPARRLAKWSPEFIDDRRLDTGRIEYYIVTCQRTNLIYIDKENYSFVDNP